MEKKGKKSSKKKKCKQEAFVNEESFNEKRRKKKWKNVGKKKISEKGLDRNTEEGEERVRSDLLKKREKGQEEETREKRERENNIYVMSFEEI